MQLGSHMTRQHEFTGDPRFAADGYHLRPGASAALDRGAPIDSNRTIWTASFVRWEAAGIWAQMSRCPAFR